MLHDNEVILDSNNYPILLMNATELDITRDTKTNHVHALMVQQKRQGYYYAV